MRLRRRAPTVLVALLVALAGRARADDLPTVAPAHVEEALVAAGKNRAQLESAIDRATRSGDPRKALAMRWLVANMPGRGYVVTALKDAKGNVIPWDPLAYPTFAATQAAYDALEKRHGTLDFARDHLVADVETVTADFLVGHVDRAFAVWEASPPAVRVGFEAFLDHVLPYRGSEEPVEDWLGPLSTRLATPPEAVGKDGSAKALYLWVSGEASKRVRFDERYYMHPTDQGFSEMERTGMGRCEDITNMITYAARARALATAADYTPAWGHRDNNHAWNVLLDATGRGSDPGNAHAAKVYRKTFAIQRDALAFRLPAGRVAPNRFLSSKSYVDVTDQYAPTTDVTVALDAASVAGEGFAYLCVFNGGDWTAIHWGEIRDGKVVFPKMGRNLAYLPMVHDGKALRAAASPLLVHKDGHVETLAGSGPAVALVATAVSPEQVSVDTKVVTPVSRLTKGESYLLQRWTGAWTVEKEFTSDGGAPGFSDLPADGLYWLVAKESRRLERIFTIEEGRQRFW